MMWSESVDEALCSGWIDGVRKRIDDLNYSVRFTPCKPGSIWSAVNIAKVSRLAVDKRMTAGGNAAFSKRAEAKSAVYSHEQNAVAELPPSELDIFQNDRADWASFEEQPAGYRKRVLHWITTAKKEPTRSGRYTLYRLYCSNGNARGINEYICYSEIGMDGSWVRYLEIRPDGRSLRYDSEHAADQYGVLPAGQWEEAEGSMMECGTVATISAEQFEAVWSATRCINENARQCTARA